MKPLVTPFIQMPKFRPLDKQIEEDVIGKPVSRQTLSLVESMIRQALYARRCARIHQLHRPEIRKLFQLRRFCRTHLGLRSSK